MEKLNKDISRSIENWAAPKKRSGIKNERGKNFEEQQRLYSFITFFKTIANSGPGYVYTY